MELTPSVWRKSSYSTGNGGDCIEIADLTPSIAVRDSKDPHGPQLHITRNDFQRLTNTIKNL